MQIINVIILVAFLSFFILEGKQAVLRFLDMKKEMAKINETKTDIEVCKDYMTAVIAYSAFGLFILGYGIYFMMKSSFLYGGIFIVLSLYCIVFILESIVMKTFMFYESGFLAGGKVYKYKSVMKISDKKKFIRGYQLKVIGDDEVFVTKKSKPILESRLQAHKNRKKKA